MSLNWDQLQTKWQKKWEQAKLGQASIQNKDKFFMIFAYPGISGFLHVGHMRGFSYTDAICRYERLRGKEVLFPVGTHASGNQAIAFANKVKTGDPDWIDYLLRNGCPEKKIKELTEPGKIVEYFNEVYINDYWKKFGFLCDWDRFICTTYPDYEKFIQWQFKKLLQNNLLVQKPYFAPYSEKSGPVAVDPSETDLSQGGNAEKLEYTLLKFKIKDDYLIAATLRPETIFGQTNLWVNPNAKYLRVEVEGENWIISESAAEKLKYQKDDIILKEDINIQAFIGQRALAPGIGREIIILPASFCDPKIGTGIVTSVPSDAPYDYAALIDLQNDLPKIQKYKLDPHQIKGIRPIAIIKSKEYGDFPALEICKRLGITGLDPTSIQKLDEATTKIYKAGFHTGIMGVNCQDYAGMKVAEAKDLIKTRLIESGQADLFYDLSEEVVCRLGSKVFIKRIDDQWFIRYSDHNLTEKSKLQAQRMNIFPKEYQDNIPKVLDWFGDRACARLGNWLGSKFPFDEQWTIEPISDSTLYPAYYLVSKFVNDKSIKISELTEEFFDYVFLNLGEGKESWKKVQKEVEYFYPLDLNLGGKEHKTVHFPVFLMNHVGILPEDKWPKGIFVNWWVTGKGSKISKSKGGAEPIPEAIQKYGVDAMRLYYAHIGSPHIDVTWSEEVVLNYKNTLERIYSLVESLKKLDGGKDHHLDNWITSTLNLRLQKIERGMQNYDLRELASGVYFLIYDDLKWYLRRGGRNQTVLKIVIETWCKLMNPLTPHLSEELFSVFNNKTLVSISNWPKLELDKFDAAAQAGEELIKTTLEGMRTVIKLAKLYPPKKFTIFIAEKWTYELISLVSKEIKVTRNVGEILHRILAEEKMKIKGREVSKIVLSLVKDVSKLPETVTSQEEEFAVLSNAQKYLEQEFSCQVKIIISEESDNPKSKSSLPGKVGILVE